jgi:hypothetical protein
MDALKVTLVYSRHAEQEARNDRYGLVILPGALTFDPNNVVEAEFTNGSLSKLVIRQPHDAQRDLILVVLPGSRVFFVKTVWTNLKTDKHSTLNRNRYETR